MIHILVPTDFSANAYNALRYATGLFKNETCTFYILNAFQTGASNLESIRNRERNTRLFQIAKETSERDLAAVLKQITAENKNANSIFKTISVADSLVNAIGKSVIENRVQYIIMGTQGASGLKSVFLGSNTVNIISKIDFCPIVAVPSEYKFAIPDTILFATGFEHVYDKYELKPMLFLAKLLKSNIQVLHLFDETKKEAHQETAKNVIEKRLKGVNYNILEKEKKEKVSTEIAAFVDKNNNIGMVAIIDYWHSFIEKLTRESVVKNIAFKTKVPLLVMHLPE
ncbi:universal stress protein [Aurantibacter crassamenti]|uniref:universal stress protein n=1 Tax=Aurantibacter crassamenti TaxID=1837375 RepID=UPI00193AA743|nr:universal stress protein [Aurantibacter crassamenti]MBM1106580.1 universal stress protein [Aurantibacter crassamenti]